MRGDGVGNVLIILEAHINTITEVRDIGKGVCCSAKGAIVVLRGVRGRMLGSFCTGFCNWTRSGWGLDVVRAGIGPGPSTI